MCLFPLRARFNEEGGRPSLDPDGDIALPCGKCYECISKRAFDWATRCRHELSLHNESCFLTLTYNPEHLPSDFIVKADFQKFLKRLRKTKKLRYMVSYEYGTKNFRPHMHAIIFGWSPSDQEFLMNSPAGYPLYTSKEVSKYWCDPETRNEIGYHSIGQANEKTAYYIASYALKGKERTIIHPNTGEEVTLRDEMDSSKRPAIGLEYFLDNVDQLVASGEPLPRYYEKKLEQLYPDLFDFYYQRKQENISSRSSQNLYDKHVNIEAKKNLTTDTFRDLTDTSIKENDFKRNRLKQNKNLYYDSKKSKGEKNE